MGKAVICAYCGDKAELTKEHVAAWLSKEFSGGGLATPVRPRHLFGGALTIEDVCATCNNEALSQLDKRAKAWWRAFDSAADPEKCVPPGWVARWIAKLVYNVQRVARQEGNLGAEPLIPAEVRSWILGKTDRCDAVACCASLIPKGHVIEDSAGSYGPRGLPVPFHYVHLKRIVFFLSWDSPDVPGGAARVADFVRERSPALRFDQLTKDAGLTVPTMTDPDMIQRGLWGDKDLVRRLAERWSEAPDSDPPVG